MTLARQTWAFLHKDLRAELRRPDLTVTAGLLAAATVLLLAFASDKPRAGMAPVALWTGATLASVLVSSRLYRTEFQGRLIDMLLAGPLRPQALFLAKTLTALAVLGMIVLLELGLCLLLFEARVTGPWSLLGAVILLGSLGLAELAGLLGVRMGSDQTDLVVTLAMMPLVVPVVVASGRATATLIGPASPSTTPAVTWLGFLLGFDLLSGLLGLWLFPSLVRR